MLAKLPLEVIDKVFGYLEKKDKLILAQVNQQLGFAFAYNVRDEYKRLSCYKYTVDELKVALPLCGSTVVDLESHDMDDIYDDYIRYDEEEVILKLISKHCVNLQSARVSFTRFTFHASKYVLSIKSLETIELAFDIDYPGYTESDLLQYINPGCKVLTVHRISKRQAQNLRQLINLEELLVRFPNNELRNIFQIGSNLKKLRVLQLEGLKANDPFQELDIEYPELEELKLFFCNIQTALPKCPKLKVLELGFDENVVIIGDTIAMYADTLEHLILTCHSMFEPQLTGKQLIKELEKCKRLKRLGASINLLTVLFYESLQSFIDWLKENGFNKERPFLVNVETVTYESDPFWKFKHEIANSEVWNLITFTKEKNIMYEHPFYEQIK